MLLAFGVVGGTRSRSRIGRSAARVCKPRKENDREDEEKIEKIK